MCFSGFFKLSAGIFFLPSFFIFLVVILFFSPACVDVRFSFVWFLCYFFSLCGVVLLCPLYFFVFTLIKVWVFFVMFFSVSRLCPVFVDWAVFFDVSFRLFLGEHLGLLCALVVVASGFVHLLTGEVRLGFGAVEWVLLMRWGSLSGWAVLSKGGSFFCVLFCCFPCLFDLVLDLASVFGIVGAVCPEVLAPVLVDVGLLVVPLPYRSFYLFEVLVFFAALVVGLTDLGFYFGFHALFLVGGILVLLASFFLEQRDLVLVFAPSYFLFGQLVVCFTRFFDSYVSAFILVWLVVRFLDCVFQVFYHFAGPSLSRYVGDFESFRAVYVVRSPHLGFAFIGGEVGFSDFFYFVGLFKAIVGMGPLAFCRQEPLG
ncbi:hypothetical protein SAMN04487969_104179 [Paenibacillus algorifonticola]|uniref:HTH araC/xylS-type domain-containing protein n=1 Tax=Paenibacillus algorifonticola TaxID=684063 RepID=A0A1I2C004_9BACL|nr:hypothetical protein SAMN04487969_104179 [Paenibacillus algorifonticola]